jgi:hypothetical protein
MRYLRGRSLRRPSSALLAHPENTIARSKRRSWSLRSPVSLANRSRCDDRQSYRSRWKTPVMVPRHVTCDRFFSTHGSKSCVSRVSSIRPRRTIDSPSGDTHHIGTMHQLKVSYETLVLTRETARIGANGLIMC